MKISIIQKKIARFIEKCPMTGELVARPPYSRYHSVRIGEHVKSLMAWCYIAYFQRLPEGPVRSYSNNPRSVDPSELICSRDLVGEIEFDHGGGLCQIA